MQIFLSTKSAASVVHLFIIFYKVIIYITYKLSSLGLNVAGWASELMKFEYQKKVASLNRHKKQGTNSEALEKAKAALSHLHTRYIVDMQSLDSTDELE